MYSLTAPETSFTSLSLCCSKGSIGGHLDCGGVGGRLGCGGLVRPGPFEVEVIWVVGGGVSPGCHMWENCTVQGLEKAFASCRATRKATEHKPMLARGGCRVLDSRGK